MKMATLSLKTSYHRVGLPQFKNFAIELEKSFKILISMTAKLSSQRMKINMQVMLTF